MSPHSSIPSPETSDASRPADARVLIIDNFDSFTYNIREAFAKLGIDSVVVRNDALTPEALEEMNPSHIIISPGPGTPENPKDIGITSEAIDYAIANGRALLGICLGHQALGHHFGANIVQADEILHGKTGKLAMEDLPEHMPYPSLFEGRSPDANVMRYHSLAVDAETFPEEFAITARTRDQHATIMAMQHKKLPIAGVQFHPESFATQEGATLLEHFLRFDPEAYAKLLKAGIAESEDLHRLAPLDDRLSQRVASLHLDHFEQFEFPCDLPPEEVYARLHGGSDRNFCFESLGDNPEQRYSYFSMEPDFEISARNGALFLNDEALDTHGRTPYEVLTSVVETVRQQAKGSGAKTPRKRKFTAGFVGGLSYEALQYAEPGVLPDAALTPADQQTFSFSHYSDGLIYNNRNRTYTYFTRGADRRALYRDSIQDVSEEEQPVITLTDEGMSRSEFEKRVERIRDEEIRTGNSFQTVLSRRRTYQLNRGSMVPLYQRMRRNTPSPNMHAVQMNPRSETIGSFPELLLRISRKGNASTYQVAGTRLRTGNAADDAKIFAGLTADPKELAEHRMLVDLARNDLSRFAIPGSVHIEESELAQPLVAGRVMHMATRVRARVNGIPHARPLIGLLPMGTTSGAPKVQSEQIIYRHERQSRGHYAGAVGFFSDDGSTEFVVGLRNVSRYDQELRVQAGSGLVYDSVPEKEYDETEQKMAAGMYAIEPFIVK